MPIEIAGQFIGWPLVIGTAAVDAINPCAIGVLILLVTTLLTVAHDKKKMLLIGTIYIVSVYITYFAAGLGLLTFIQALGPSISAVLGTVVGTIIIVLGFLEIKDFWWYGEGISLQIPAAQAEKVKRYISKVSIGSAIFLGAFVAAVELPCTGGPYLGIVTLISRILDTNGFLGLLQSPAMGMLAVYNFIFVLPLIMIVALAFIGADMRAVKNWKEGNKKWMRLFIGLVMVALGIVLILFSKGIIGPEAVGA